jgi:hypothetical protein
MAKKEIDTNRLLDSSQLTPQSGAASPLRQEYEERVRLYEAQPAIVRHFVEGQARKLAEAVRHNQVQTSFMLPDRVVITASLHDKASIMSVPEEYRQQATGGVIDRLARSDMRWVLRQRLAELEDSAMPPVAASAKLLRHALVMHMVQHMLPSGRSVTYRAAEGEEIPTLPVEDQTQPESAITQASDAIAEEKEGEKERGELQTPFVPAARRFYLPQWVAFDDQGHMLVKSVNEAESHLASMQAFLTVLHNAVAIAPYIVADPEYQQKRYGMLGQLINQGRALAWYETEEMIAIIQRRAAAEDLNRGLSLSVPYFDDQDLQLRTRDFEVIPAGRIMFVPAFVVRAAREEQVKAAQDTRLNASTRKYLLIELVALEKAFLPASRV